MYNIWIIILLFFIYSFIGWFQEVIQALVKEKKFVNRGFLIGPLCPIYGFGGISATVLFTNFTILNPKLDIEILNVLIVFVGSMIICSIFEYLTSWVMEKIFNNRWWDYSDIPYNINGRICLICSLCFGLGCAFALKIANPFIVDLIELYNIDIEAIKRFDILLMLILFIDTVVSFNIINNFKNISNSIIEDSTDKITTMVRKTILNEYSLLYRRLVKAFPNMRINNTLSLLKDKILNERKKLEKSIYKIDIRKTKLKELEKEYKKAKRKDMSFMSLFKKNK